MSDKIVMNLVSVLLHSLWQGVIIMLVLALILRFARKNHNMRYGLSLVAMLGIVIAATVTYSLENRNYEPVYSRQSVEQYMETKPEVGPLDISARIEPVDNGIAVSQNDSVVVNSSHGKSVQMDNSGSLKNDWQYLVMYCWFAGVSVMLMRMLLMLSGTSRLINNAVSVDNVRINDIFRKLTHVGGFAKNISIAISNEIISPCIAGVLRPVILLPACITGLSAEEITAILSHELAHIRRFDWLVNIFQMIIESLLFFNPAVWWVSRQIRLEREAACDQYAVKACASSHDYAELLVKFASMSAGVKPAMALNFSHGKKSSLAERIKMLIVPGYKPFVKTGLLPILFAAVIGTVLVMSLSKGADQTIEYIGKNLSPQQRQEITQKAVNDSSLVNLPEDKYITLKGRVVMADGSDLAGYCESCGKAHSRFTAYIEYDFDQTGRDTGNLNIQDDGSFETKLIGVSGWILLENHEAQIGQYIPFEFTPGEVVENFQLVLKIYPPQQILIVDENNAPIDGAKVTGGYPGPPRYNSWHNFINVQSDASGLATINHFNNNLKFNMIITAEGYECQKMRDMKIQPGTIPTIIMKKVPMTTVVVTDAATGKAVPDAIVLLHGGQYNNEIDNLDYYISVGKFRKTDQEGKVYLNSLSSSEHYLGMVMTDRFQRKYLEVLAGEINTVDLDPARPIIGTVTGNLACLPSDDKGRYLNYTERFSGFHVGYECMPKKIYIVEKEGKGYFEIKDYYGQIVTLTGGPVNQRIIIESQPPLQDYSYGNVTDISNVIVGLPETAGKDMVKVKLIMKTPDGKLLSQLNGKIMCLYVGNNKTNLYHEKKDIVNGIVEFEAKNYQELGWQPDTESGYYFERKWFNKGKVIDDITEDIICFPAGSIIGSIKDSTGNAIAMSVNIIAVEHAPVLAQFGIEHDYSGLNGSPYSNYTNSEFVLGPLPLGGTYYIRLSSDNTYWRSDDIKLTEKDSVCKLDVKLPELVDVKGRIVGDDGKPLADTGFSLCIESEGMSHYTLERKTDASGEFEIKGINSEAKGIKHSIQIKEVKGYLAEQELRLPSGKKNLQKYQVLTAQTVKNK